MELKTLKLLIRMIILKNKVGLESAVKQSDHRLRAMTEEFVKLPNLSRSVEARADIQIKNYADVHKAFFLIRLQFDNSWSTEALQAPRAGKSTEDHMKEIVGTLIAIAIGVAIAFASKDRLTTGEYEMLKLSLSTIFYMYMTIGFGYYAHKYHSLKKSLSGKSEK